MKWCSFKGWRGDGRRFEHGSGLPSLTRLSNFDTIKTERINLHPPPTLSAGSRRDASGEEMVLKKRGKRGIARPRRAWALVSGLRVDPFTETLFTLGAKVTLIRKARRDFWSVTILSRTHVHVWGFLNTTDFHVRYNWCREWYLYSFDKTYGSRNSQCRTFPLLNLIEQIKFNYAPN